MEIFSLIFLLVTCVKLLFTPAYRSTDFEVHRNWLAITYSTPVSEWYYENTSAWTLDYPPLFAWFEYALSYVAQYFDEKMLKVGNIDYSSDMTILFQRLSVITTDLVLAIGAYQCSKCLGKENHKAKLFFSIIILANSGLFMIDHIHFQYNGMLYGILLLSIAYMIQERWLASSFWFSILLNMKHIFAYIAPAYVIYLVSAYCLQDKFNVSLASKRLLMLGLIVMGVFIVSFGPFIIEIAQVMSRLFPFKRGLCHAYWAPNIWAVYNVVDKLASYTARGLGISVNDKVASMTGGLVQDTVHTALPTISATMTFCLSFLAMIPALLKLWWLTCFRKMAVASSLHFIRCLIICGGCSFLFGWHVHEKAVLILIIPLSILAVLDKNDAKVYLLLSTTGHYSLFPLLYTPELILPKLCIFIFFCTATFFSLSNLFPESNNEKVFLPLLNRLETIYILGFVLIFLYENILHIFLFRDKFPFLPLLLTSLYCSIGLIYSITYFYKKFIYFDEGAVALYKRKIK